MLDEYRPTHLQLRDLHGKVLGLDGVLGDHRVSARRRRRGARRPTPQVASSVRRTASHQCVLGARQRQRVLAQIRLQRVHLHRAEPVAQRVCPCVPQRAGKGEGRQRAWCSDGKCAWIGLCIVAIISWLLFNLGELQHVTSRRQERASGLQPTLSPLCHTHTVQPTSVPCLGSVHLLTGSYGACQMPEGRGRLRKSRFFGPKGSTP